MLWSRRGWIIKRAMRLNEDTALRGSKVMLVPYEAQYVSRYHEWMMSEELQRLTASEPLTLEQEYEMQRSWKEDEDKCTFIILNLVQWEIGFQDTQCMVGDVNLFILDPQNPSFAEIEIMIAEPIFRHRGFGEEAVRLMLYYGVTTLGITTFQAKILKDNIISTRLFRKLHFKEVSECPIFQEVNMQWNATEAEKQWLIHSTSVTVESFREAKHIRDNR